MMLFNFGSQNPIVFFDWSGPFAVPASGEDAGGALRPGGGGGGGGGQDDAQVVHGVHVQVVGTRDDVWDFDTSRN